MNILNLVNQAKSQLMAPGAPFEIKSKKINGQSFQVYRNAPLNLAQVINDSRRTDEQTFLVYQGQRWSYKTFFEQVDSLASYMHQQGVVKGDRIAIAMRNRPEWVIAFCATALIGAVPAPLNSFGVEQELLAALATIEAKFLICDGCRWERINQSTVWPSNALVLNDTDIDLSNLPTVKELSVALNFPSIPLELPEINDTDSALVLFTSGATSVAKAVVSNHIAVCQALYNIDFIGAISAMTSPEALARIMEKGLVPTILTAVPLFHVSGLHAQLLSALRGGRRLVFTHKWDPLDAIELIKQEQVTQFNGAPSMVMQLLREPSFHTTEVMKSFCGLGFGGAGLPATLIDKALSSLSEQMIGVGFGMTETNGVGAAASGDIFRHEPKSSGLVSPIMDVKICARGGEPLPANSIGEVCMRGISIMDAYVGNNSATQEAIRSGWLHTGDLGYIDDDGFLFIVDRIKDVINRAGENISSAEVESCLLMHTEVGEAAVFGIPDEETGEAVVAVVCPLRDKLIDEALLLAHVAQRLAKYKVPSKIHISNDKLPRNPAGKLLRNTLKKSLYQ
ncbi:class I adenylate-forming enzyme family protein [Colwellia sp. PAMC 21821]|uniref:class I adenylate-forming enzyme family protein n=1 Tax=Colwellia sp. PAMC 21821 TaxID=1816219 RepID=UPI0009BFEFEC|nr:class I adenylate-forming enzyme family protein [Colwellia sp. PAMC 21821]ARD46109.1 AMP-binding protein [Colwellia sp. PAMC 21821]